MKRSACSAFLLVALLAMTSAPLNAQIVRPIEQLEGVGIVEHLDESIPLVLNFTDDNGKLIHLQQLFDGTHPVVLSLNYSSCPMLCGMKLRGMLEALSGMSLEAGRDYHIVSVSIDPLETPMQARLAKQGYVRQFGKGSDNGWHFLTGRESQIRALADAVGFQYRYIPERREYAHAAAFMICTPDGRLSRYLYGVQFDKKTVQLSLVEAAQGKIGTTLDQVLLFCFHYDANSGNYAPAAVNLMKFGGATTVLAVLAFVIPWRRKTRLSRVSVESQTSLPVSELPT
jgi:protein SCO1/2